MKNAPVSSQRMMDLEVYRELREAWLLIYINDMVLFHYIWSDLIQAIRHIILICKQMNMTIYIKKCKYGHHEVKALRNNVPRL